MKKYDDFYATPLIALAILAILATLHGCARAQVDDEQELPSTNTATAMTPDRLAELILAVDAEAKSEGPVWSLALEGLEVAVIYDDSADRMRIIVPIGPADDIPQEELVRLMQANFDSTLDARYAIAQEQLWGAYIHPLSDLSDEEFLTALGETVNVVLTYGTSYSSGLFIFNGGDSGEIQRRALIDELRNKRT